MPNCEFKLTISNITTEVFLLVARGASAAATRRYESSATRILGEHSPTEQDGDKNVCSRMDLKKEGLFNTHMLALFKKRAAFFRRDKKAWVS